MYEIGALNHDRVGGMARVATLIKQHEARYQTFVVLAGDFLSPSVIGTRKVDGQKVNGRQMVDIMNKAGVDLVTFGNHEFDITENGLQQRINESQFAWVSSDVMHKDSNGTVTPFYKAKPDSTTRRRVPSPSGVRVNSTRVELCSVATSPGCALAQR